MFSHVRRKKPHTDVSDDASVSLSSCIAVVIYMSHVSYIWVMSLINSYGDINKVRDGK